MNSHVLILTLDQGQIERIGAELGLHLRESRLLMEGGGASSGGASGTCRAAVSLVGEAGRSLPRTIALPLTAEQATDITGDTKGVTLEVTVGAFDAAEGGGFSGGGASGTWRVLAQPPE